MRPYYLLGLGIVFFLFVPLGIYLNLFLLYGIGLTLAGISFVLVGILLKKNSKCLIGQGIPYVSFLFFWLYRLFILTIGILALYGSSAFLMDLPKYLTNDYSKLEGVPEKIVLDKSSDGKSEDMVLVTINGKRLTLNPTPKQSVEKLQGRYFVIKYLPNTKWIIEYTIKKEN